MANKIVHVNFFIVIFQVSIVFDQLPADNQQTIGGPTSKIYWTTFNSSMLSLMQQNSSTLLHMLKISKNIFD